MNSSPALPVWTARRFDNPADARAMASPASIDDSWRPLAQPWHAGGPESDFRPGWAQLRWHETGLHYDAVFMGSGAHNSAQQLNERTWELGDVGEVFVQSGNSPGYLEVHVTPENSRLQLLWTADGLARVRSKAAALKEFMISLPDWVHSQAQVGANFWAFQLFIPATRLALTRLQAGQMFRTAVCRYHDQSAEPVLSSTAPLPIPFFHHREGWHPVVLVDAP
jgi:hypothetical protein